MEIDYWPYIDLKEVVGWVGGSLGPPPSTYSTLLPNLLLPPSEGSQMTNQFINEEISMLFCLEKFYGWMGGCGIAIIATSSTD